MKRGVVPALCAGFILVVFVVCLVRLGYGVDFADEALYVAIPYRFALGDQAFVDEHFPAQGYAILTWPFIRLFCAARGSNDGLVLYTRLLYFGFQCIVGSAVVAGIRPLLGTASACVVALICVAFCPLVIPNLSYNTVSCGFFTIGVFLGTLPLVWGGATRWLALAGCSHALAVAAMPGYAVPVAAYALAVWLLSPRERRLASLALYCGCGLAIGALFIPTFLRIESETMRSSSLHLASAAGLPARLRLLLQQAPMLVPMKYELAAFLVALWVALKLRSKAALVLLALLPLFPLLVRRPTTSLWYVLILAPATGVLFLASRKQELVRKLFIAVWLPSLCAGAAAAFMSANGWISAGFGLLPALLIGAALAVDVQRKLLKSGTWPLIPVFPMLAVTALVLYLPRQPSGDDPVSMLDTRIRAGPYQGVATSSRKAAFIHSISEDLAAFETPGYRILFAYFFPAGYLMSGMRPAASSTWTMACTEGGLMEECRETMLRNIASHQRSGLLVVTMREIPAVSGGSWTPASIGLESLLESEFVCELDRGAYAIYRSR